MSEIWQLPATEVAHPHLRRRGGTI